MEGEKTINLINDDFYQKLDNNSGRVSSLKSGFYPSLELELIWMDEVQKLVSKPLCFPSLVSLF